MACLRPLRRWLAAGGALVAAGLVPGLSCAQLTPAGTAQFSSGGQAPIISQARQTTDITLQAPRTLLGWSAFNLTANQTAIYRFQDPSWIVLNKVSGQTVIDGQIEALVGTQRGAGNVWFSSPGGVIFGPNARVTVGSLMATPATVAAASFLDASSTSFDFVGGGGAGVSVRAGAQLTAVGGGLALIAGNVATEAGASLAATGSILYGAAGDFTVHFANQHGDLDLVDFVVPAGGGTGSATPLDLRGQTVGGNVFLAVVNRSDVLSSVINATGVIAAQSATTDRGDVVLSGGAGIVCGQPAGAAADAGTQTTVNLGRVSAQRDLLGALAGHTSVTASQLSAGRDLGLSLATLDTAAMSAGHSIAINASGAGANAGPAVKIATMTAADDILVNTTDALGSIVLGQATLTGAGADQAPTGRTLALIARGANADITYGPATGSPLIGATNVRLAAGHDATVNVTGLLSLNTGSAGRAFTIRAGDLNITRQLTAQTLRIESLNGPLTLGGSAGAAAAGVARAPLPGMLITDAEFHRIKVSDQVSFYAGSTAAGAGSGDLVVLDLAVDPALTPHLLLAAGPSNDVMASGVLAPLTNGGTVQIGDASDAFRPGRIVISGALGSATGSPDLGFSDVRAFDRVELSATNDIILGSARFLALIAGLSPDQININQNQPVGVAPTADEMNHVFLTAGVVSFTAPTRIVQENTGSLAHVNGLLLNNLSPTVVTLLTVAPAKVVDLFASFRDKSGVIHSGLSVGGGIVQVEGAGGGGTVRLNGARVTNGVSLAGSETTLQAAVAQLTQGPGSAASAALVSSPENPSRSEAAATAPPPLLAIGTPDFQTITLEPGLLGAGSEEVWRKHRDK
jgi:filamentous hemagglutinin family protein